MNKVTGMKEAYKNFQMLSNSLLGIGSVLFIFREFNISTLFPSSIPSSLFCVGIILAAIFFRLVAIDCLIQQNATSKEIS